MRSLRLSEGTAGLLGLKPVRAAALPTTAYLMLGEACIRDCAFCAQARGARSGAGRLARVSWPEFDWAEVAPALTRASEEGLVERVCAQTVAGPEAIELLKELLLRLKPLVTVPASASLHVRDVAQLASLFALGLDRAGLAIDVASDRLFREHKGGNLEQALQLLEAAAQAHPGRVSTHLIAGLGETEQELLALVDRCLQSGITVGLFAFTPVRGTRLAERPAPDLSFYRRVQAARWLLQEDRVRWPDLSFDAAGRLDRLPLPAAEVAQLLGSGVAFQTSGCAGCNRPYYNERPGGRLYNFPRPLTASEIAQALEPAMLIAEMPCAPHKDSPHG